MIAKYISGCTTWTKCPPAHLPEFAFTGRSNVGKSSLINAMTGINKLAKISSTPGKTQIINHFLIDNNWYLADLPGYGYARISKKTREKWQPMMREYLSRRENLMTTFVLIDSRLEPQKIDLEFIDWLGENSIPLALVFTKADKCSKNELKRNVDSVLKKISENWEELPAHVITSSETGAGIEDLLQFIDGVNRLWVPRA
ncbi:MAG TPA: ribosome biogenesis GTP-binding protein YihA/YsxC [Bacteroidales bacterium]|nr:ribosome biogenesis GTP-binding protein YihA/YsxC [Bacteroidales bacterium]